MEKIRTFADYFIDYTRRHKYLMVLIVVTVSLGIAFTLRKLTPTQTTLSSISKPELPVASPADFSSTPIKVGFVYPTIAPSLPVYSSSVKTVEVGQLTSLFELQATRYENHYENEKLHRRLTYTPSSRQFEYSDTAIAGGDDPALSLKIDKAKSVEIATAFARKTLGLTEFSPINTGIQYYDKKEADEAEPLAPELANVAEIPFSIFVEGKETYVGTKQSPPLTVFVDSSDKVIGFRLSQDLFILGPKSTVPTVDPQLIIELLKGGKVDILRMYGSDTDQFALQNMKDLTINALSVQYRFVQESRITLPYYYVDGTVTFNTNLDAMKIIFTLPAVQTSAK